MSSKKNQPLGSELKELGRSLKSAYKAILSSRELQHLETELKKGASIISRAIGRAYTSAKESPESSRLKSQAKKVARVLATESRVRAKKVQRAAAKEIRKAKGMLGKKHHHP